MTRFIFLIAGLFCMAGCGFQPIYATPQGANAPANRLIRVASISAPADTHPAVSKAIRDRIELAPGAEAQYELTVVASEVAEPLAVQIDASVTRYNYRLSARYTLRHLESDAVTRGAAQAVTSYNIVRSQYSTLYAESTARGKASRNLAEEIERDILLKLSRRERRERRLREDEEAETLPVDPLTAEDIGVERIDERDAAPFVIEDEDGDAVELIDDAAQ